MENILSLNNVCKAYKRSDFAIKNISFNLPYGKIMGFIGENGAGKSTTIDCILNVLQRDSGEIKVFNSEMLDERLDIRERIGIVYDSNNFPEYLNARQLADIFSGIYKEWDNELFLSYMRKFNLDSEQIIKNYSRGMSMKLAITMALSHKPELLILDEATGGLDPVMRDEILDVLLDFVRDESHSIFLSSHITGDLEKIADYIVLIHNGQILLNDTKDKLIYEYGIIRCSEDDISGIDKRDIVAVRKRDYQVDILVSNKQNAMKNHKSLVIDNASLEEITLILVKGEVYERTI